MFYVFLFPLLNYYYNYLLYGIYEHTFIHIHTVSNMCGFFGRVSFEMHFSAFYNKALLLLTKAKCES